MAFTDSDFISKEDHELDYVLKKWGKRGTAENRRVLSGALDEFNRDPAYPAHTRKDFYEWAKGRSFVASLADTKAGDGTVASSSGTVAMNKASGASASGGEGKKKLPWWLWLIIAVLVVLVVLFFLRACDSCSDNARRADEQADSAQASQSVAAVEPAEAAAQAADASALAPAAAPVLRALDLSGIPADALTIRFKPNSDSELADGYAEKLSALAALLSPFDTGSIVLTGHCASIGYPAGEMRVSEGRAAMVAEYLRKAGLASGITVRTVGKGATELLSRSDKALNRRVVLSLE